jgi:hypothetical protein
MCVAEELINNERIWLMDFDDIRSVYRMRMMA